VDENPLAAAESRNTFVPTLIKRPGGGSVWEKNRKSPDSHLEKFCETFLRGAGFMAFLQADFDEGGFATSLGMMGRI
jgi:hypothetical protein